MSERIKDVFELSLGEALKLAPEALLARFDPGGHRGELAIAGWSPLASPAPAFWPRGPGEEAAAAALTAALESPPPAEALANVRRLVDAALTKLAPRIRAVLTTQALAYARWHVVNNTAPEPGALLIRLREEIVGDWERPGPQALARFVRALVEDKTDLPGFLDPPPGGGGFEANREALDRVAPAAHRAEMGREAIFVELSDLFVELLAEVRPALGPGEVHALATEPQFFASLFSTLWRRVLVAFYVSAALADFARALALQPARLDETLAPGALSVLEILHQRLFERAVEALVAVIAVGAAQSASAEALPRLGRKAAWRLRRLREATIELHRDALRGAPVDDTLGALFDVLYGPAVGGALVAAAQLTDTVAGRVVARLRLAYPWARPAPGAMPQVAAGEAHGRGYPDGPNPCGRRLPDLDCGDPTPLAAPTYSSSSMSSESRAASDEATAADETPAAPPPGSVFSGVPAGEKPIVTIFGAGVTGLSAAHELAERGFQVQVVEKAGHRAGERDAVEVGGMARSQWAAMPAATEARERALTIRAELTCLCLPVPTASAAGPALATLLPALLQLAATPAAVEMAFVARGGRSREDAERFAKAVAAIYAGLFGDAGGLRIEFASEAGGPDCVELRTRCGLLPGEHGYRFFPSFYRHLFDTMRRTPLYDAEGLETGRTAFDRLVPTYTQVFANPDGVLAFTRDKPDSFEGFRREYVRMLEDLGFEKRDIVRFALRMFRYMSTCSDRRGAEYEEVSWWEFLVGARRGGEPAWAFSDAFSAQLKAAPQALVAMDAETGDARTQGNMVVQLMLDQFERGGHTDSTLDGPTSSAWLDHWRTHLEELGVRFYAGELMRLEPPTDPVFFGAPPMGPTGRLTADISWLGNAPSSYTPPDYYIVALDPVSTEKVTRPLAQDTGVHGVPAEMTGYTTMTPADDEALAPRQRVRLFLNPSAPEAALEELLGRAATALASFGALRVSYRVLRNQPSRPRVARLVFSATTSLLANLQAWAAASPWASLHGLTVVEEPWEDRLAEEPLIVRPEGRYGTNARDRLQTFAGIQFYFDQEIKVAQGHLYFPESEWGLSAISQLQFWRHKRALRQRGVRGLLSVDIGNWRAPSRYTGKIALDCTAAEIAREVWRQTAESLRRNSRFSARRSLLPIPQPIYWHIDAHLRFEYGEGVLEANEAPFQVNNAGDWDNRPKDEPMNPTRLESRPSRSDEPFIWQADHGGYRVHYGQLLFAGNHMRTFTRMATMEAANESARHAVNAILDHLNTFGLPRGGGAGADRAPSLWSTGSLGISGDYAAVWDPEEHELDDLDVFKRVDAALFEMGKPHLADILGLDALADRLHPESSSPEALLAALMDTLRADLHKTTEEAFAGLSARLQKAAALPEALEGWTQGLEGLKSLFAALAKASPGR